MRYRVALVPSETGPVSQAISSGPVMRPRPKSAHLPNDMSRLTLPIPGEGHSGAHIGASRDTAYASSSPDPMDTKMATLNDAAQQFPGGPTPPHNSADGLPLGEGDKSGIQKGVASDVPGEGARATKDGSRDLVVDKKGEANGGTGAC